MELGLVLGTSCCWRAPAASQFRHRATG